MFRSWLSRTTVYGARIGIILLFIFRLLKGSKNRFTVRIGDHYRALGRLDSTTITWVWIGSHSDPKPPLPRQAQASAAAASKDPLPPSAPPPPSPGSCP